MHHVSWWFHCSLRCQHHHQCFISTSSEKCFCSIIHTFGPWIKQRAASIYERVWFIEPMMFSPQCCKVHCQIHTQRRRLPREELGLRFGYSNRLKNSCYVKLFLKCLVWAGMYCAVWLLKIKTYCGKAEEPARGLSHHQGEWESNLNHWFDSESNSSYLEY